jgi:ERAP1-like C-terminal domain
LTFQLFGPYNHFVHFVWIKLYLKWLIQPAFDHVGFVERIDDTHLTTLNRNQILSWACKLDISGCVDNAAALFAKWMDDPDNDGYALPRRVTL